MCHLSILSIKICKSNIRVILISKIVKLNLNKILQFYQIIIQNYLLNLVLINLVENLLVL